MFKPASLIHSKDIRAILGLNMRSTQFFPVMVLATKHNGVNLEPKELSCKQFSLCTILWVQKDEIACYFSLAARFLSLLHDPQPWRWPWASMAGFSSSLLCDPFHASPDPRSEVLGWPWSRRSEEGIQLCLITFYLFVLVFSPLELMTWHDLGH